MSQGKRAQYTLEFKIEAVRAALARRSREASRTMDSVMGCVKQGQGHSWAGAPIPGSTQSEPRRRTWVG